METLRETLRRATAGYAGRALNGHSYRLSSPDGRFLAVLSVGQVRDRHIADTGLIAHLQGERIVIERDVNDTPLVDALLEAGIPRGQIALAYAGESARDAA